MCRTCVWHGSRAGKNREMMKLNPFSRIGFLALVVSFSLINISLVYADSSGLGPKIIEPPKDKATQCVTPVPDIRRRHMIYLDHHRDQTVHRGDRDKKFSLKGCINCHAIKGEDGKFLTVENKKHFCRVCHDYAAVKLDCFECHASRPLDQSSKTSDKTTALPDDETHQRAKASRQKRSEIAALSSYLKGVGK